MPDVVLQSIHCPQCAGPLGVAEGRRLITCDHCGVRLLVGEQAGYSRWYFPAKIGKLEAVGVGSAWLKKHPGIDKSARSAAFVEASLLYAPIWEYKALVAGWEFGSKLRTQSFLVGEEDRNEHLELQLVREKVAEPRLNERRYYEAALDLAALGATRPRITGREFAMPLLPGELREGALLEAGGTAGKVMEAGRRSVLTPLVGDPAAGTRLFPLRESVTLLYYPLWLLRFRVGSRLYEMTVDGRAGTIFSARAPAANTRRLLVAALQMVVLAAVAAMFLHLPSAWGVGRLTTVIIAVVVSLVVLFTARQFRLHGEVEYHEPYSS
ncbi:MAG: hypothetical protein M1274_12075 [Actinobacteria bacterium]|nr:hypothetical protein [Actinomycetota bacterium]